MIAEAHTAAHDTYYNRDRVSIYPLVQEGANVVLDLGCGAGMVGKRLLETKRASSVTGVEIYKPAADEASKWYDRVHQGDIEQMELEYDSCFDYVICADILEHLRDPKKVVARIGDWLKPGGKLICSVPNVRNWDVLKDLILRGNWEYQDSGIMDETHLRFFTRKSFFRMLERAGFQVESYKMLLYGRRYRLVNSLSCGLLQEFLGSQVLSVSRKSENH
jgi:2-polyprenyl-3-methyl-5-hydroxy-6-metoxy-1,4-benzoquinol methylase